VPRRGARAGRRRARSRGAGPDPLITEVQDWAQYFGDGVDATPYGLPIEFEATSCAATWSG
jgi:sulfane dehydrogenase subunit SoxC